MSIIFLAAISIIVLALIARTTYHTQSTSYQVNTQGATRVAESGIEKAVYCLNTPSDTTNCSGNPNFGGESNATVGNGKYTSTVTGSGNSRTIVVTGTVKGLLGSSSRQLGVTLTTTTTSASFQYGVQAGEGGITLSNNAKVNGNAYTNGSITGSNGSSITGDAVLAVSNPATDQIADPVVSPLYAKNFGDASSTLYLAQSFISGVNDSIYSFDLKLAKHNSPTSTITTYIYSDNAGNPGTNLSGGGQLVNVSIPNDSPAGWENGWTNQLFSPNTILLPSTKYWLVLKVSSSNSSKYWTTVRSVDDTTYANGTAKIGANTTTMTALNYDLAFRIKVGGQYPTLNIPSVGGNAYSHIIDSTIITKKAYYQTVLGTVKANVSDTCTEGENGPNCYDNQTDQPPQSFPLSQSQITQMEAQAAAGGTVTCSPTCTLNNGDTIGPKKYIGNISLTNNAVVTIAGTVWVVGNISLSNNAVLQLSSSYGTNSGVIIADDAANSATSSTISFSNNGDLKGQFASCSGSPKKCSSGLNSGASCTVTTDCPTNTIMAISMNSDPALSTAAIDVANNLSAGVLYAPYGLVNISNNASLKEVTGQKMSLSNNAQITYLTGLASLVFTSGPGGSWTYQKGSYQIIN